MGNNLPPYSFKAAPLSAPQLSGLTPISPAKLANRHPWMMYDWLGRERCQQCPALPACGGGCPHRHRYQPEQFDAMHYCDCYLEELRDRMHNCAIASGGRHPSALTMVSSSDRWSDA